MNAAPESPSGGRTRTISVDYLARVEGEGALDVRIESGEVVDLKLRIFEPPRFFEGILRGRKLTEAPDITARICGICPVAYQMSACHAMERACGIEVDGQLRELRRLLYCAEWISSHALHIYMLHAPDFLGAPSAIEIARERPDIVKRGLRLKKLGNDLMGSLGGRAVAPVNVRVGGFYRVPGRDELAAWLDELRWGLDAAVETARWVAGFEFPDLERDYEFVALRDGARYPMNEGRLVSGGGLDIDQGEFDDHFEEIHVPHSTALHARRIGGGSYFVGPMARFALNRDLLTPVAARVADETGLGAVCRNPYRSIVVRAVETVLACESAIAVIEAYEPPPAPFVEAAPRAATGRAITEAPRGNPVPPLRDRGRGHDRGGHDRAADLAEPDHDRGGPAQRAPDRRGSPRRRTGLALRADHPQLRPVHLLRDPLPEDAGGPVMTASTTRRSVLVVGVGTPERGDDAAGRHVARRLAERPDPAFAALELGGEALELMDAWEGARGVVLVDAVVSGSTPGTVSRFDASAASLPADLACASTHDIGLAEAIELSRAMGLAAGARRGDDDRGGAVRARAGAVAVRARPDRGPYRGRARRSGLARTGGACRCMTER